MRCWGYFNHYFAICKWSFAIMTNHLTTLIVSSEIFEDAAGRFNAFVSIVENFLYTMDNLHILAITLCALLFVSFLFAGIYFVMKLLSVFSDSANSKTLTKQSAAAEENVEHELAEELKLRLDNTEEEISAPVDAKDESRQENTPAAHENTCPADMPEDTRESRHKANDNPLIELDWKKSRKSQTSQTRPLTPMNLKKNIRDLICLIVNMLGRNIDELKIAQTLMFRSKDDWSEEAVIQLVASIKEFLDLCHQGAFDSVRRLHDLPSDEDCILRLLAGDTTYAMALLEALMDDRINLAVTQTGADGRKAIFQQTSGYACHLGTLAEVNDPTLATASFELAVEMNPDNPLAWSRCADIYKKTGQDDKADRAYRNALKLAERKQDKRQEANACKFLSQYLYAQGESTHAAELYLQSKNYYDSIGINRPLDRKELEIIEQIDNTDTSLIINSVLHGRQNTSVL